MKKLLAIAALATAATAGAQNIELGLTGGYAGGLSGEMFVHSPNVIGPVGIKVGVSYARAADAINDNSTDALGNTFASYKRPTSQGGLGATEYGSHVIVGVDATYGLGELAPGIDSALYAGARYGMFKSTEDYGTSGGRTTYSSNAFGVGGGAMVSYALTGNLSLVGDLGADYFFKSTINTTQVQANGTTVNDSIPTSETASYAAASNRFVRPGVEFKARVGIKYTF